MTNYSGYLSIILHMHLPFVRHPEYPDFLEEDWLFEAITESYIPLWKLASKLIDEGVQYQLTISISPTVCEMLIDPFLRDRYLRRLERMIELSEREMVRLRHQPVFSRLASLYYDHFSQTYKVYTKELNKDLVSGLRYLKDAGRVELMASAATHAILPMIKTKEALQAQLAVGIAQYSQNFHAYPSGFWLPECAYAPGIDDALAAYKIKFFVLETHGILHGSDRPLYGVFAPIKTQAGVVAFGRDPESSKHVWSAKEGYPGDPWYREFYRDLGYDADEEYIRPFLHSDGTRSNLGIKYYRITGQVDLKDKQPYVPEMAKQRAEVHAGNFLFNREHQIRYLHETYKYRPIVIAPYDAELFGHWWFEGPEFLEQLIRKIAQQSQIKLVTPSEYLAEAPPQQILQPSTSSWGEGGYFEIWLRGGTDWMYRHLHQAEERMVELSHKFKHVEDHLKYRALNQTARELLLAQSSDWAFIIATGSSPSYARKRFIEHIQRFNTLYEGIVNNTLHEETLAEITAKDPIFPGLEYSVFG